MPCLCSKIGDCISWSELLLLLLHYILQWAPSIQSPISLIWISCDQNTHTHTCSSKDAWWTSGTSFCDALMKGFFMQHLQYGQLVLKVALNGWFSNFATTRNQLNCAIQNMWALFFFASVISNRVREECAHFQLFETWNFFFMDLIVLRDILIDCESIKIQFVQVKNCVSLALKD